MMPSIKTMMAGMIKYKAFVIIHPEKGGKIIFYLYL
jgi:hypothetical protein